MPGRSTASLASLASPGGHDLRDIFSQSSSFQERGFLLRQENRNNERDGSFFKTVLYSRGGAFRAFRPYGFGYGLRQINAGALVLPSHCGLCLIPSDRFCLHLLRPNLANFAGVKTVSPPAPCSRRHRFSRFTMEPYRGSHQSLHLLSAQTAGNRSQPHHGNESPLLTR